MVIVLVSPIPTSAGPIEDVSKAFASILYTIFVFVPGWILALLSNVLVWVLSYNDFGKETIVDRGWVILRDLSNMFFIIIMLVIAIGTILKSPKYGYQNNLRRLLLMAILINFSKTIALFFIDFSQAITIAFANAFITSIQAGIPQLLGITGILSLDKAPDIEVGKVLVQIFLSAIMIIIACVVVSVISILLLFRIVYLQFLVMLSPLAFLASTWEKGFSYYQRWWDQLGNYLVLGPVLTFFLWLSFSAVQFSGQPCTDAQKQAGDTNCSRGTISSLSKVDSEGKVIGVDSALKFDKEGKPIVTGGGSGSVNLESSEDTEPLADALKRYFVGIILLMGSLFMAQELGTAGAGIGRAATNKISSTARGIARAPARVAGFAGRRAWSGSTGEGGIKEGLSRVSANLAGGVASRLTPMTGKLQQSNFLVRQTLGRAAGAVTGGLSGASRAESRRKERKVAAEQKGLEGSSTEQLRFLQADMNRDKALAATRMLAKRKGGFEDYGKLTKEDSTASPAVQAIIAQKRAEEKQQNDEATKQKRQAMENLARGGQETKEEHEKFQQENFSYIENGDERQKVITRAVAAGDGDKLVGNIDVDHFENLPDTMQEAMLKELNAGGVSNDDFEKGSKRWKKEHQESFSQLFAKANGYDKKSLAMFARLNPGQYGIHAAANLTDPVVRGSISSLTGEQMVKIDPKQLEKLIPHLNVNQIKALGEKGDDDHRRIIIENIDLTSRDQASAKVIRQVVDSETFVKNISALQASGSPKFTELKNARDELHRNKEEYEADLVAYRDQVIKGRKPAAPPPKHDFM